MFSRYFVVAALAFMAMPAFAQPDFQHHQAMVDIAATPPWDYNDYGEDDGPAYSQDDWHDWTQAPPVQLDDATVQQIAKYRAFMDGQWFHAMTDNGAASDACVATFMRQGSGAMVTALGGANDWALLGVFSPDAPRPTSVQTVQVTLTQTGDKPASVNAFSLPLPWDSAHSGLIVFAVPSASALIGGMLDAQEFSVAIKGKRVAHIVWSDGYAARDALTACIAARPKG